MLDLGFICVYLCLSVENFCPNLAWSDLVMKRWSIQHKGTKVQKYKGLIFLISFDSLSLSGASPVRWRAVGEQSLNPDSPFAGCAIPVRLRPVAPPFRRAAPGSNVMKRRCAAP